MVNWTALGAIGQFFEVIVIFGSALLLLGQLSQMRAEQSHSRWAALQWATSVVRSEDITVLLAMARGETTYTPDRFSDTIRRLLAGLHLVYQGIEDGYVDPELYMLAHADELAGLYPANLQQVGSGQSTVVEQINKYINASGSAPARVIQMAASRSHTFPAR